MKHDFNTVIEIQPMQVAFYRNVSGLEYHVLHNGNSLTVAKIHDYGSSMTTHEFEEGETVHPDEVTAMVCTRCGYTVWIQGSDLDFAQECSERQGIPSCESQYVIDVMMS
jgi:hypothetical protein